MLCRCPKGQTLILPAEEGTLDGIYVVRTRLPAEELEAGEAVAVSWWLSEVERAFPVYEGVDLKVRPIHHWRGGSGPGPRFPLPLAYYIEWHMKRRLESTRSGENGDGEHSFPTPLSDLATLTRNTGRVDEHNTFNRNSRPTELQQRALNGWTSDPDLCSQYLAPVRAISPQTAGGTSLSPTNGRSGWEMKTGYSGSQTS